MKFLLVFLVFCFCSISFSQCPIIPTPLDFKLNNEILTFKKLVIAPGILSNEELVLFNHYLAFKDIRLETGELAKQNIAFSKYLNEGPIAGKTGQIDGYSVLMDNKMIEIAYTSQASKLYGLLSVVQLIEPQKDGFLIHCADILDYAKFEWRGLHLDVARHFFTVDEVKRYIDLMAFYKFNKFHWHLTDDQGWRIEIKKYPKLTSIGGFRDSTVNDHYNTSPRTYNHKREGGFYLQEEIKDVVAYAKARSIEIIPEIEMPGHARAALAAYPELSCTGMQQPVPGLWGIFDDIFCAKPSTISFLQDVLAEVIPLFPSEYVHIGGDEAPKKRWKECDDCQQIIHEHHLKDEHQLQSYFIQQMDDFLTTKGKKLIGWDEILEGGLSTNAAVMSWRGEQGGIDAAEQNHKVVMSPNTYCYFDYYQSGDKAEPLAIGGYLPLEKVYEYKPIPDGLEQDKWKYILGGQANLWTEYISNFDQVEYMVYPRALALIQSLWCVEKPNYSIFLSDFRQFQEPILKKMGVNYSKSIYATKITPFPAKDGIGLMIRGVDSLSKTNVEIEGLVEPFSKAVSWNDSILLKRGPNGILRTVLVATTGINDERLLKEQEFYLHNGVGSKVELITHPHSKYSIGGGFTLVDGILGTKPWKGNEWLGFNEHDVEFTIQFPSNKKIESVEISFLDAKGSWIYLPDEIEVFIQNEDGNWVLIKSMKISSESVKLSIQQATSKLKFKTHSIDRIPEGVEGAGNLPWTFIDEVQITYEYEN